MTSKHTKNKNQVSVKIQVTSIASNVTHYNDNVWHGIFSADQEWIMITCNVKGNVEWLIKISGRFSMSFKLSINKSYKLPFISFSDQI